MSPPPNTPGLPVFPGCQFFLFVSGMPTFTYLFPGRQFYFLFQGRQFLFIHFRDANFYSFFSGTPILIYLFPGRQLLFIYFRDANLGQKIPAASLQLVPSTVVWRVPPTPSPPPPTSCQAFPSALAVADAACQAQPVRLAESGCGPGLVEWRDAGFGTPAAELQPVACQTDGDRAPSCLSVSQTACRMRRGSFSSFFELLLKKITNLLLKIAGIS